MYRLMVFDLDNTLAKPGKGMTEKDISLLKQLENRGSTIAICSGKPTYYLCGFMRQVGLWRPILLGENGAVIQFGVDLPPKEYYVLPYSDEARASIKAAREKITELLPHMWYQPNEVALTPFPASEEEFEIIAACLEENRERWKDITVYRHEDTFDIVPAGINKKKGMEYLGKLLEIGPGETVATGDGINDYPLFDYAAVSIGVNIQDEGKVDQNFRTSTEALEYLQTL